jgi:hypothetical protein
MMLLASTVWNTTIRILEPEGVETLKWAESELQMSKRSTLKPEPWEEVSKGAITIISAKGVVSPNTSSAWLRPQPVAERSTCCQVLVRGTSS